MMNTVLYLPLKTGIVTRIAKASLLLLMGAAGFAHAADHEHRQPAPSVTAGETAAPDAFVPAEVRYIDHEQGRITLKHGPILRLNMEAMTMRFRIAPALLAGLVVGDQVRFLPERVNGQFVVTAIEKLP